MHTDPTQITTAPTEPTPPPTGDRPDRTKLAVSGLIAAILLLAAALMFTGGDDPVELSAGEMPTGAPGVDAADSTSEPETTVPATVPTADPEPEPDPDPEPDPEPEPEPGDPCDLLAAGQALAVTAGPVELPVGTYAGELVITNCGDLVTAWSASTLAPGVQLGVDQGLLAPGASIDLQFAVDPSQIVGSSMSFTIEISEPGFDTGVMVKVTKPVINPDLLIDPELVFLP